MRTLAAVLAVGIAGGCAREPQPVPPPRDAASPKAAAPDGPQPLAPPGHPPLSAAHGGAADGAISGRVELSPSLAGRSGAAVFVIARNAKTQEIVAVRKEDAAGLPVAFSISGADAMTGGTSFEGPLDLTARLSRSGDAVPAKGDVEGVARGLLPGARDVRIVLDTVRQ
ncbi:MAG TPA: hypothetical protein VFM88_11275 [Vicinamibacteria bacterium]|nr:hypothetical protein [Vicinamibacteria bacterium]